MGSARDGDKELEDIIESLFSDELRAKGPNAPLPSSFPYPDVYAHFESPKGECAGSSSLRSRFDGSVSPPAGSTSLCAHAEVVALSSGLLDSSAHEAQRSLPPSEEQSDASSTLSNCRFSTTELLDLGEELLD